MKKFLLGILAGVVIIGSASAAPSPEDRKALCDKKSDGHVWVPKTQACVPIDPCISDNETIKDTYCVEAKGFYFAEDQLDLVLGRYAEKVLKSNLFSKKVLDDGKIAIITWDGGYAVVDIEKYTDFSESGHPYRFSLAPQVAAWAYGYESEIKPGESIEGAIHKVARIIGNVSETECEDIRDFASLIGNYLFDSEYNNGECLIKSVLE